MSNSSPQVLLVVAASRPPSEKRRPQDSDLASLSVGLSAYEEGRQHPLRRTNESVWEVSSTVSDTQGKNLANMTSYEWKGEVGRLLKERKRI